MAAERRQLGVEGLSIRPWQGELLLVVVNGQAQSSIRVREGR